MDLIPHPALQATDALLILALLFALSHAQQSPEARMPRLASLWRRRADEAYARERAGRHAGGASTRASDDTGAVF